MLGFFIAVLLIVGCLTLLWFATRDVGRSR